MFEKMVAAESLLFLVECLDDNTHKEVKEKHADEHNYKHEE